MLDAAWLVAAGRATDARTALSSAVRNERGEEVVRLRGGDPDTLLSALRKRAPFLRGERIDNPLDGAQELEVVLPTRRDARSYGWAEGRKARSARALEAAAAAFVLAALALLGREALRAM